MRTRITTRQCAVCDKLIPDTYVVCSDHKDYYKIYGDTEWFKYCVETQRRQFEIDLEEEKLRQGIIDTKKRYAHLDDAQKFGVRWFYNKGIGAKNIARIMDLKETTVSSYLRTLPKNRRKTNVQKKTTAVC